MFNGHRLPDGTWFGRFRWTGVVATVLMPVCAFGSLVLAAVLIACRRSAPDGLAVVEVRAPRMEASAAEAGTRAGCATR